MEMAALGFRLLLLVALSVAVANAKTDDSRVGATESPSNSERHSVGVDDLQDRTVKANDGKSTASDRSKDSLNVDNVKIDVEELGTSTTSARKNKNTGSVISEETNELKFVKYDNVEEINSKDSEGNPKPTRSTKIAEVKNEVPSKSADPSKPEVVKNPVEPEKPAPQKSTKSDKESGKSPKPTVSKHADSAESAKSSESSTQKSTNPTIEDKAGKYTTKPKGELDEPPKTEDAHMKWKVNDVKPSHTTVERPMRILAVIPFISRSHFVMFGPLFRALAARGHKMDVLSHYPLDDPPPNYRDLSVKGSYETWDDAVDMDLIQDLNPVSEAYMVWYESLDVCIKVMEHPVAKQLRDSTERYDLVITELFGSECLAGFGYKFQVPTVGLISSVAPPSSLDRLGNPDHPAYIANYFLPYTEHMSFWQRLVNTFHGWTFRRLKQLMCDRYTDSLARSFFGADLPSSVELARNMSLVLVNSHFSSNQARPMVPGAVEVGGLHIGQPKPLPEELERFVAEAEAGVVLFSLGTMVRVGSWEAERLQALWGALGALPQRVLLKSKDPLPGAPPNVRVQSWLPQLDLLCHPKVVAFVTHGGLMGTQEAVWAGVPMLGIPMFADQDLNLATYASKGVALVVHYHEMTRERLLVALKRLTEDPRFRERAAALSRQFRDRPLRPLDEAVWWVEYVVRHGGAPQLKSAAADMPLHQLLLLDVLGALLLAAAVAFAFVWFSLATVYRFIGFGSKGGSRGRRHLPNVSSNGQRKRYTKTKQH